MIRREPRKMRLRKGLPEPATGALHCRRRPSHLKHWLAMTWRPKSIRRMPGSQYLQSLLWAAILGLASSLACIAVRIFFRLLQWSFTGHSGLLSDAAEHLPLWRRAITPPIGALFAMAVIWATKRFAHKRRFEEYV